MTAVESEVLFAFASDGSPPQLLAIAQILRRVARFTCHARRRASSVIALPSDAFDAWRNCFAGLCADLTPTMIHAPLSETDPYYAQLTLSEVFRLADSTSLMICLDYDHLVLGELSLSLEAPSSAVLVSSETRTHAAEELAAQFAGHPPRYAHANTSLIVGSARELRRIGSEWVAAYMELSHASSRRYLTELSFGLAAARAGCEIVPCKGSVQGNFANRTRECALFHYGGDSVDAKTMKRRLQQIVTERTGPWTDDSVDRADAEMRELLVGLLAR